VAVESGPDGQALPQPPQLLASVSSLTQTVPQRLNPLEQISPHAPDVHTGTASGFVVVHASPHIPQLAALVARTTSQPSAAW
jgi:hypothetical protein